MGRGPLPVRPGTAPRTMHPNVFALGAIALWASLASLGVALNAVPPFLLTGMALLIGSLTSENDLALTVTASTKRPVRLSFAGIPTAEELRETILQGIADDLYHTDVHGAPAWRKQTTLRLAEEIRSELRALP